MKVSCRADRGRKKGYIHLYIYAVVCCQLIYVVCIFTLFLYITYVLYLLSPVWHGEIDGRQKLILRILIMKIQNLKLHTCLFINRHGTIHLSLLQTFHSKRGQRNFSLALKKINKIKFGIGMNFLAQRLFTFNIRTLVNKYQFMRCLKIKYVHIRCT